MESVPLGYHPATATIQLNVPTTTLDAYVESQGLEAVNLVKIDVEGAELMVLRGMRHVLKSFRPLVIVELVGTQRIEEGQLLFEEMSYDLYCTNSLPIKGQRATNILAVPRGPVD